MSRDSTQPDDRDRFEHLLRAARDAVQYRIGRSRADLDVDSMLLRALTHCVQEIGEAGARVTDAGRLRAASVPWPKLVGMRHILVHAYYDIDADAVWRVVEEHLPELIAQLENALKNW
jgi:uncharacterized protein with HEPN domain